MKRNRLLNMAIPVIPIMCPGVLGILMLHPKLLQLRVYHTVVFQQKIFGAAVQP